MRIAICDHMNSNSNILKQMLYTFSNYKKIDFVVDIFRSNKAFLEAAQNYALIFISFESQSGIKLAQRLYKDQCKTPIIIFSENYCHAAEAFRINAYNFIKMPLCKNSIFTVLDDFFVSYLNAPLLVSDGFESVCINISNILYLEADNKHCRIHLNDQTVYCNKTMARVFSVLPENRFLKINRAFIVNSDYVARFSSEYIILTNGDTLYPSRHFYKSFKTDYCRTKSPRIP